MLMHIDVLTHASRSSSVSSHVFCTVRVFSAGLRIKENKEVYEGEVTELTPEYTEGQVRGVHLCVGCSSACALPVVHA